MGSNAFGTVVKTEKNGVKQSKGKSSQKAKVKWAADGIWQRTTGIMNWKRVFSLLKAVPGSRSDLWSVDLQSPQEFPH